LAPSHLAEDLHPNLLIKIINKQQNVNLVVLFRKQHKGPELILDDVRVLFSQEQ
jgi:hypothetical protein